jgi:hypothetical protein
VLVSLLGGLPDAKRLVVRGRDHLSAVGRDFDHPDWPAQPSHQQVRSLTRCGRSGSLARSRLGWVRFARSSKKMVRSLTRCGRSGSLARSELGWVGFARSSKKMVRSLARQKKRLAVGEDA